MIVKNIVIIEEIAQTFFFAYHNINYQTAE